MSDKLGRGAYGKVIKRNNMAVKQFEFIGHVIQEYSALMYLKDCQYVVNTIEVDYEKNELSMELYDMSLRKYLSVGCCCVKCINHILHDILMGMIELHDRGLAHSDLKPGNILMKRKPLKAVLGDCGFVSISKYSKQQRTAGNYRDLIVVNDEKHDIYSFGIILMELIYSISPVIYTSYKEINKTIHYQVHQDHKRLIKSLMHEDRNKRPSARDILLQLFKETPEKPILVHYKTPYENDVYERYGNDVIKDLEQLIIKASTLYDLKRPRNAYKTLINHLYHNHIDNIYLNCHLSAILIIFASCFGNRTPKIQELINHCHVKNSKKRLYQIIYDLTNDHDFLNIMFSM